MNRDREYKGASSISKYYADMFDQFDREDGKEPVTDEDRILAQALSSLYPGHYMYPSTDSIHEAIPFYLNALYEARTINRKIKELRNRV